MILLLALLQGHLFDVTWVVFFLINMKSLRWIATRPYCNRVWLMNRKRWPFEAFFPSVWMTNATVAFGFVALCETCNRRESYYRDICLVGIHFFMRALFMYSVASIRPCIDGRIKVNLNNFMTPLYAVCALSNNWFLIVQSIEKSDPCKRREFRENWGTPLMLIKLRCDPSRDRLNDAQS